MIITFYIILNLVIILAFFLIVKKHLKNLEILVHWFVGSILFQNFSAVNYMNYKKLIIPEDFSIELTHFFNRMILIPLLFVWFLNQYIALTSKVKKLTLSLFFLLIFLGIEWLAEELGVLEHKDWKIWWSVAFWTSAQIASVFFMKYFRKKLNEGVGT